MRNPKMIERLRKKLTAERAIKWGAAAIAAYEIICPDTHTISEGVDRLIEKHPILTRAVIGYTALHLCNWLPEKLDLYHQATRIKDIFND